MQRFRESKQIQVIARFALGCILLSLFFFGFASRVTAAEVIQTNLINMKEDSAPGPSHGGPLPTSDAQTLCLDGREYKVNDPVHFLPSVEKVKDKICVDSPPKTNLCSKWEEAQRSYTAAAKALGIPLQVLMCLTHIESSMNAGLTSKTGAKGLTQFQPTTAADYQRKFRSDPEYKKAWANYKMFDGTTGDISRFTTGHIISNSLVDSDVQIFATAMYLRDAVRNTESFWKAKVGEPPQVLGSQMTKLYHFLMISYNAGPASGEQYIKGSLDSYRKLPGETQGYINKFDKCINSPERRVDVAFCDVGSVK